MKKLFTIFLAFILTTGVTIADEGMWLPFLIKNKIVTMQKMGLKLSADQIYSVNQACLKDAIVHFGGGCTGELISDKGLLITNHHCGFSQIQSHSSVEHDYLRDGFWAKTLEEELPNKDLSVKFLLKMEDVTESVLLGTQGIKEESERDAIIKRNIKALTDKAITGNGIQAKIESIYYGNQYILYLYEVFTDVRLVGAPPSSIGKFGGDTDNWMWPRHTGDFSIFRIYANKDNKPASYSKENVPYIPKKFFTISAKGVKENDFTFVYGYPGRTQQYIVSEAVKYITDISNPHKINLRTIRLNIQNEEMNKSQAIRIKYAAKNANVANAWKKWQGERGGLIRLKTVEKKRSYELKFNEWAKNRPEYNSVVEKLIATYKEIEPYSFANDYFTEAVNANESFKFAGSVNSELVKMAAKTHDQKLESLKSLFADYFKDYYNVIDKKTFIALMNEYNKNISDNFKPEYYLELLEIYKSTEALADYLFDTSVFTDESKALTTLNSENFEVLLSSDPFTKLFKAFAESNSKKIKPFLDKKNGEIAILYRTYMKGLLEFDKMRSFYPDANSTLRITYGKVCGYSPRDAVDYKYYTTLDGIMEKDNPEIYDYNIPQKLRDLYNEKDYGIWAVNGTIPVCFVATNHTSGGNSGSPVIDSNGYLVGLNFDRAWEGTMSDIEFDPKVCRNITLDIRYVLFILDKLAGADNILKEIKIVR